MIYLLQSRAARLPVWCSPLPYLFLALLGLASPAQADFIVNNTNDSGMGSLRQAVLDANMTVESDTITFAATLNGATITLATQIDVAPGTTLLIDASALSKGITVSGGGTTRIFLVGASTGFQLNRLRLIRGQASAGNGGAIELSGTLGLIDCTFTDNAANAGGAIHSNASSTVNAQSCTFNRNSANDSGALFLTGNGNSFLTNCTFTGNRGTAANSTGAITLANAIMTMNQVTVFENTGDSTGGGVFISGLLALNRCLLAGNTASSDSSPDLFKADGATINTNGNPSLIGNNGLALSGSVSAEFPAGTLAGTPASPLDPKLRPLGYSGGATQTLAPRIGSPALDAAGVSPFTNDQRGFPRGVGSASDLGAVERGPIITVTNVNDAGAGSLRGALAAATAPDTWIQFAGALNGQTIALTSAGLELNAGQSVELDASSLASGLTISGGGQFRVVGAVGATSLALQRITIMAGGPTGGGTPGPSDQGMGVSTGGSALLAVDCSFVANNGSFGGALRSDGGRVALYRCTFSGNTAMFGPAVSADARGILQLTNCTISGNRVVGTTVVSGCVLVQGSTLEMLHTTATENQGWAAGGGVYADNSAVRVERCLMARNFGPEAGSPDFYDGGGNNFSVVAPNLIGNNGEGLNGSTAAQFPTGTLVGTNGALLDPKLGPLARTGGITETHSPRAASVARDNAGVSPLRTDQRGFPRGVNFASDLGAVERGPTIFVTSGADSGPDTLRAAVAAATAPDTLILVGVGLSPLVLTSGPLQVAANQSIDLDFGGVVSGGGTVRIFDVAGILSLHRMTLTEGRAVSFLASAGGAVTCFSGSALIASDCTFQGNSTTIGGGAILADNARVELTRCTLVNNTANDGGGILIQGNGNLKLSNCTISGNQATGNPGTGGLTLLGGSVELIHTTITGNSGTSGGGVFQQEPATVRLERSIIARNTSTTSPTDYFKLTGVLTATGNNLIGDNTSIATEFPAGPLAGTATAPLDPRLGQLANNGGLTLTHALLGNSPAIDAGGLSPFLTDQRGVFRGSVISGNASDLGSFEFTGLPTVLANIATRLRVETGDNVLIGGFIITGSEPKKIIARAIGSSLSVPGHLTNPTLELRGPSGLIVSNDDWRSSQEAAIIASTIAPTNDLESAIVATLPANGTNYTVIVRGVGGETGVGVVEVYDLDRNADSKLANISTRGLVQTGDNVMIGGFIIVGSTSQKVIVRAIGPSLSVAGKLADPTLELRDQNGTLTASNDNWRSTQEAEIVASTIPPSNDLESAIVATLPPGAHTAIVRGKDGTTGVALAEVYALQ